MELLSLELWLMMFGIVFCATFTQVLTGFGFGLIAVPLLLFILPSQQALIAGMILSMLSSALQGVQMRHLARWDLIFRLLFFSIPGLALGVILSEYMNGLYIKGIVGSVLIGYVGWQWFRIKASPSEVVAVDESEGVDQGLKTFSILFILVAFSSGLLNGLAAIPGPPIVALLINHLKKDAFQATTVNFFFLQYAVTTVSKSVLFDGNFDFPFAVLLFSMMLAIALGYLIGQPVRKRINEDQFKKVVYGLLLIIGLTSVSEPILLLLN
ncbi:putative permease [Desulfitobacterium dichloroeliminans LMG P-21439]|uniref:Probable membrane transporter protein n=1 Tax=Desulfitobacterium dichloroeliminans (strain LMG P-21439 / DCA1) TaxID=871963 RepID=L0FAM0_DESDL|nr:putative permease [Desulfitobacterium dichloroeliminans LMG P-21439]